jgi:polysaccharide export outer membrane protein
MKRMWFAVVFLLAAFPAWGAEKLGIGDAVRVTVFQQPDLTTETRITEKGTVTLPLVGELKLAGLAPAAAGAEIAGALKRGNFLKNPQVSVEVVTLRSRQVSVLGLVARPGRYALDESSSRLADVIAAAGGIAATGADTVTVIRDGKEHRVDVLGKPFALKGGETIHVERAPLFYIYGEVTRAGAYRLEPNMTVMQALATGGGITPRGSDRRLKLRRTGPDGKPVEADAGLRDLLQPNDVIYVRESLF